MMFVWISIVMRVWIGETCLTTPTNKVHARTLDLINLLLSAEFLLMVPRKFAVAMNCLKTHNFPLKGKVQRQKAMTSNTENP